MKDAEFINKIKDFVIPKIESLISKEKEHLVKLKSVKIKNSIIEEFISTSKKRLKHLETRLIEYQNYIKIWN